MLWEPGVTPSFNNSLSANILKGILSAESMALPLSLCGEALLALDSLLVPAPHLLPTLVLTFALPLSGSMVLGNKEFQASQA